MALLKRILHNRSKGSMNQDEDWWRIVFDTESKRLYVEHEWEHLDPYKGGNGDCGTREFEISDFLLGDQRVDAKAELETIISSMFEQTDA